ncbi:MAG: hypothetical protein K2O84_01560 [Oscillospiraceae bacterium]|nr:hypothetical protein [Oscillospiraceae bacterium]
MTKLTPEISHKFINKIVASNPEELEQGYLTYYKAIRKRKKKTAQP